MKRTIAIALCVAFVAFVVGCAKKSQMPKQAKDENLPADDQCGTVLGKVKYVGTPPKLDTLPVSTNPECSQHYTGTTAYQEDVLVAKDGGLANVFVYVKSGIDEKWKFKTPDEPVVVTNEKCVYVPRVSGAMRAQEVKFVNEDSLQHNVHTIPVKGDDLNRSLYSSGQSFVAQFDAPQVMMELKCDLHTWMTGWLGVLDHPFFAVTKEDGSWQLPRKLPEGTYTLSAWQEKLGTKEATVTVKKGETITVPDITFP